MVGKAAFNVREWARLGRIQAVKRKSGWGGVCLVGGLSHGSAALSVKLVVANDS